MPQSLGNPMAVAAATGRGGRDPQVPKTWRKKKIPFHFEQLGSKVYLVAFFLSLSTYLLALNIGTAVGNV